MNRYWLAPLATADLDETWLRCAQDAGTETADRLIHGIEDRFRMLGDMPHAGRNRPDFGAAVRCFPAGSCLIYYAKATRGRVQILRVIHGRRDQNKAWRESSNPHHHR